MTYSCFICTLYTKPEGIYNIKGYLHFRLWPVIFSACGILLKIKILDFGEFWISHFQIEDVQPVFFLIIGTLPLALLCREKEKAQHDFLQGPGQFGSLQHGEDHPSNLGSLSLSACHFVLVSTRHACWQLQVIVKAVTFSAV